MTEPKEYIVTEPVFNHIVAALRDNRQYDVAEYLIHEARPHTSVPAPEKCQICVLTPGSCLAQHDAQVAKAERERVLGAWHGITG